MVNFTQARKAIRSFRGKYLGKHFVLNYILLMIMCVPIYILGLSFVDYKSSAGGLLWLLAAILFMNMVKEDYSSKMIDMRKAGILIFFLLYLSPFNGYQTVCLFTAVLVFFQLCNFLVVVLHALSYKIEKIGKHSMPEECSKNTRTENILELPFLPMWALAMSIYSIAFLCLYFLGKGSAFYLIYEVIIQANRDLVTVLNGLLGISPAFTYILLYLWIFLCISAVIHRGTARILRMKYFSGTKYQEINGIIAFWDMAILAAFVVFFCVVHVQLMLLIYFTITLFICLIHSIGNFYYQRQEEKDEAKCV